MVRIRIVCSECGSDDVRRDATAAWCVETQEWELCSVQDQGYCEDCGGEASLDEEEIEGEAPAPPDFDPAKVTITRHRMSTTQGEVTVAYDGNRIERYGDDIRLDKDGEYHGQTDEFWIEVARKAVLAKAAVGAA